MVKTDQTGAYHSNNQNRCRRAALQGDGGNHSREQAVERFPDCVFYVTANAGGKEPLHLRTQLHHAEEKQNDACSEKYDSLQHAFYRSIRSRRTLLDSLKRFSLSPAYGACFGSFLFHRVTAQGANIIERVSAFIHVIKHCPVQLCMNLFHFIGPLERLLRLLVALRPGGFYHGRIHFLKFMDLSTDSGL